MNLTLDNIFGTLAQQQSKENTPNIAASKYLKKYSEVDELFAASDSKPQHKADKNGFGVMGSMYEMIGDIGYSYTFGVLGTPHKSYEDQTNQTSNMKNNTTPHVYASNPSENGYSNDYSELFFVSNEEPSSSDAPLSELATMYNEAFVQELKVNTATMIAFNNSPSGDGSDEDEDYGDLRIHSFDEVEELFQLYSVASNDEGTKCDEISGDVEWLSFIAILHEIDAKLKCDLDLIAAQKKCFEEEFVH